jgi:hypothetical protein
VSGFIEKAPNKITDRNSKTGPHPFPSPAGRGDFKPFSPREKGGMRAKGFGILII